MIDGNELVTVTSHLKKDEADRIKGTLNSARIHSIVSGHDAASRYNSLYYQIRVKREDFRAAKQIRFSKWTSDRFGATWTLRIINVGQIRKAMTDPSHF